MKKLNSRGEELFTTAFKTWKNDTTPSSKKKKYIVVMQENVIIRVEKKTGDFTITTSSQVIQGTAKALVHEQFRDVYPYTICVLSKKTMTPLFKCEWCAFELTTRKVSLIKHR
jgi:hypothetical protein